ncbi:histidine triad (HIT) family protein [Desulfohalotomaculum tongense]|uniref:histidine triad nucleotide-binding protein n=1 Tax=Desulforadius tongensis TaxID=1216062 RepID=UPI00195C67F6|nr:histidine triad nucleotide-binding protein [Desulforadius tongensis]MBM7855714.1 histidine triad (HIT) family protein [Desulforadius tongensis]
MADCIFCKIVNKEIPAEVIYEDDRIMAFKDINPVAPTHVLLIPKKHISTLLDLQAGDGGIMGHIVVTAQKLAKDLGLEEKGFRLVSNCKEEAGQTVFHIHFHLLGGRPFEWPPG